MQLLLNFRNIANLYYEKIRMYTSPFEQFKTHGIIFLNNVIVSNNLILLLTILSVTLTGFYFIFSTEKSNAFSIQAVSQVYNFLFGTIKNYLGHSVNFYFPFLFFIFCFIIFCNLIGLLPYSFTITSQLYSTLFWHLLLG